MLMCHYWSTYSYAGHTQALLSMMIVGRHDHETGYDGRHTQ